MLSSQCESETGDLQRSQSCSVTIVPLSETRNLKLLLSDCSEKQLTSGVSNPALGGPENIELCNKSITINFIYIYI